jgi:hypothetical protein
MCPANPVTLRRSAAQAPAPPWRLEAVPRQGPVPIQACPGNHRSAEAPAPTGPATSPPGPATPPAPRLPPGCPPPATRDRELNCLRRSSSVSPSIIRMSRSTLALSAIGKAGMRLRPAGSAGPEFAGYCRPSAGARPLRHTTYALVAARVNQGPEPPEGLLLSMYSTSVISTCFAEPGWRASQRTAGTRGSRSSATRTSAGS